MKTCPHCRTQYTDDTLRFCLQDGTPLEPTVSFEGPGTDVGQASEITQIAPRSERTGGSRAALAIGASAFFLLLLAGAGAAGLWFYFGGPGGRAENVNETAKVGPTPPLNNVPNSATPPRSPQPSPTVSQPDQNSTPAWRLPTEDQKEAVRGDIVQQVQDWKDSTESGSIDRQIDQYAPSVEYYRKRGATPEFIRADKIRAYRMFDSISVTLSDMSVSVADSGDAATAVFDKEWVFEGSKRSTGKVRQQLQFRKISGRWRITSERDLKVYYTN